MSTQTGLTGPKIRVVVVDDHAIVREGIAEVLSKVGEFEVVGQAGDADEAVQQVRDLRPDVVIMDILMPEKNGVEACREVVAAVPETRVLMLTASNNQTLVAESVDAGATGYLQKYSNRDMLLSTVREVVAGEFRVQGEAARELLAGSGGGRSGDPGPDADRVQ